MFHLWLQLSLRSIAQPALECLSTGVLEICLHFRLRKLVFILPSHVAVTSSTLISGSTDFCFNFDGGINDCSCLVISSRVDWIVFGKWLNAINCTCTFASCSANAELTTLTSSSWLFVSSAERSTLTGSPVASAASSSNVTISSQVVVVVVDVATKVCDETSAE